ncbi:cellulose biosynthesis cyclic di-GMP-binding regulatory protein BcsB [Klebsiella pneumoniae]|nr:cellulose biosynthesis cyclic di-GMP-binding regulatory protein BcsB [Klebsiella pneumoniae]
MSRWAPARSPAYSWGKIRAQPPIDPLYITDFNRVRLEFVGYYRDVCENRQQYAVLSSDAVLSDLTYQSPVKNNDLLMTSCAVLRSAP